MKTFTRLLGFLLPLHWLVALAIVLGCATIASGMGLLGMAAYLISAAALKPLLVTLTLAIYIVRFMGVSRAVARYAERLVSHSLTFRLLARLRLWFYTRLEPLAPARLLELRSGDMLARLVGDVEELQTVYLRVVAPLAVVVAIAALTWALLAIFDARLAWTTLAFMIAAGVVVPLLGLILARGLGRRQRETQAGLHAHLVDGVQGVQDILACGDAGEQRRRLAALDRVLARLQGRASIIAGMQLALHDALMNLAVWALLVMAVQLVMTGAINGVYLAALALLILAAFEAVQPLGPAFSALGRSIAAGERVFAVADATPAVAGPTQPQPVPDLRLAAILRPADPLLSFEEIHFAYDAGEPEALCGISLAVQPGSRIAIVGPSGSGKSTLVRLALRYWDPSRGAIRLAGRDIRQYAPDDLRSAIGLVSQDTYIFNDTVRNNLLLARPDATDQELGWALTQAQMADVVERLPDGLATWVGEQGLRLSGGERQRLAIARALLKDAPLLVLDEATANLDPLTERALLAALNALMSGRTTLMITHRLVAMEQMDEIVVVERGRIVERGTHDALKAAHGLYQQMLEAQDGMLAIA